MSLTYSQVLIEVHKSERNHLLTNVNPVLAADIRDHKAGLSSISRQPKSSLSEAEVDLWVLIRNRLQVIEALLSINQQLVNAHTRCIQELSK